ncbi:MAG: hypothetical protein SH850_18315 [Planctomycetaceae bacterium]|nr:hypothetical protein [Planctomycetaceae bacterium]
MQLVSRDNLRIPFLHRGPESANDGRGGEADERRADQEARPVAENLAIRRHARPEAAAPDHDLPGQSRTGEKADDAGAPHELLPWTTMSIPAHGELSIGDG